MLELSASMSPEMSAYKEARVLAYDASQSLVYVEMAPSHRPASDKQAWFILEEAANGGRTDGDTSERLHIALCDLVDARIVREATPQTGGRAGSDAAETISHIQD